MKRKTVKKKTVRPHRSKSTLYTYVTPENSRFAHRFGKKEFGSYSAYLDHLISRDRKRIEPITTTMKKRRAA
jgi:hypothetical protein